MTEFRVSICGLGLIGGSIGAALVRQGLAVRGYDRSPEHSALALELGLVSETASTLDQAVGDADLVVVAAPLTGIIALLNAIAEIAGPYTAVIDTGSVKRPVVEAMELVIGPERFVGGHPIAGKERSGPTAADADLFTGAPFVLTPTAATAENTMSAAHRLVDALGARPIVTTAREHDRVVARTSHLPQILSTALARTLYDGDERFAGPGARDMVRLAQSSPRLWREIALANRENIAMETRRCISQLEEIVSALEDEDGSALEDLMEEGVVTAGLLREVATW